MNAIVKQYMAATTGVSASGRGRPSQLEYLEIKAACVAWRF